MRFLDYIKGHRKGKEARRIELESMYDSFLEEAIEGYDSLKGDHAKKILEMQSMISKRTKSNTRKYILSIAVSAAVVLIISYFSVFDQWSDKSKNIWSDTDENVSELYVYVPQEYLEKKQIEEIEVTPIVEIDNIDELLEPVSGIDVYIPEEYLERERNKMSTGKVQEKETSTTILNLDKILEPEAPINIYLPADYVKKKKLNS